MTLWDLLFRWFRQHRPRRHYWMAAWPQRTRPQRFNIIQRYAMRRVIYVVALLLIFKVNPFHPISLLVTILGSTLVVQEHRIHRDQHRSLFNRSKRKEHW